jgi:hypothetical protein
LVEFLLPFFVEGLPFLFFLTSGTWIRMAVWVPEMSFFYLIDQFTNSNPHFGWP